MHFEKKSSAYEINLLLAVCLHVAMACLICDGLTSKPCLGSRIRMELMFVWEIKGKGNHLGIRKKK